MVKASDGIELIQSLKQAGRATEGIIISGSSPHSDCTLPWMRKPFQPSELAETIRELIGRLSGGHDLTQLG